MISTFWSNLATPHAHARRIVIGSGQAQVQQQTIDLQTVLNRGELVGIFLEILNLVAAPGAAKNLTVFYAFSQYGNRVPDELATASASQACLLENSFSANGTRRDYSLPINYQGGRYLHIWFTSDTFTAANAQLELDLQVLAKVMN